MIWPYSLLRTTSSSAPTRPWSLVHGNLCAGSYRNLLVCDRCACGLRDLRAAVHVPFPAVPWLVLPTSMTLDPKQHEYTPTAFAHFEFLDKFRLYGASTRRLQSSRMYRKELQLWTKTRVLVFAPPSVDYVSSQYDNNLSGSSDECGMAGGAASGAWVGLKELPSVVSWIVARVDLGSE
ncbi:hypothetical protein BC826DRAFT_1065743 [Russula brevipes]|nr:hypothetical protein BC826DRAFT_1065743 [Russula brevipes]